MVGGEDRGEGKVRGGRKSKGSSSKNAAFVLRGVRGLV
jgi:hypothetical protein